MGVWPERGNDVRRMRLRFPEGMMHLLDDSEAGPWIPCYERKVRETTDPRYPEGFGTVTLNLKLMAPDTPWLPSVYLCQEFVGICNAADFS